MFAKSGCSFIVIFFFASVEFDYRGEASNLIKVHDIVTPKWGSLVRVPLPEEDYCSKHILVMEFLEGVRLVDGIRKQYRHVADHFGVTLEELEEERKMAIRNGTYQFKSLEEASVEAKSIDWIETGYDIFCTLNPWRRLYNATVPSISYAITLGYTSLPALKVENRPKALDLGALLSLLYTIHGHEIFEGSQSFYIIFVPLSNIYFISQVDILTGILILAIFYFLMMESLV